MDINVHSNISNLLYRVNKNERDYIIYKGRAIYVQSFMQLSINIFELILLRLCNTLL